MSASTINNFNTTLTCNLICCSDKLTSNACMTFSITDGRQLSGRPLTESISTRFNAATIYECVEGKQAQHDVTMLESVAAR